MTRKTFLFPNFRCCFPLPFDKSTASRGDRPGRAANALSGEVASPQAHKVCVWRVRCNFKLIDELLCGVYSLRHALCYKRVLTPGQEEHSKPESSAAKLYCLHLQEPGAQTPSPKSESHPNNETETPSLFRRVIFRLGRITP